MLVVCIFVFILFVIVTVCVAMNKANGGANNSTYSSVRVMRTKPTSPKRPVAANSVKISVSVSTGDDEPPRPAVFSSPAIKVLAEEYRGEYHRDYPFLDPDYSPGSHMPFMDLTPQVGEWIAAGDEAALYELWGFIGDFRHEVALREALRVSVPEEFEISDFAKNEMWAIYALTLRMELAVGHGEFTGAAMMATTLSTRNFTMSDDLKNALERLVLQEFKKRNKEFESTGNSPDDAREQTRKVMAAVNQGVAGCENFAAIMKTVPPTVREAISGAMRLTEHDDASLWNRRIHYSLGYGERAYGCSEKLNRECAESLGILEAIDPATFGVPSSVTKAMITEALTANGIAFKKSAKRDDLLKLAWQQPGLVNTLVNTAEPDLKVIKEEYAQEASVWAERNRLLLPFAQAMMTYMGLCRINQPTRLTTLDKVLENQSQMVSGEYRHTHQ